MADLRLCSQFGSYRMELREISAKESPAVAGLLSLYGFQANGCGGRILNSSAVHGVVSAEDVAYIINELAACGVIDETMAWMELIRVTDVELGRMAADRLPEQVMQAIRLTEDAGRACLDCVPPQCAERLRADAVELAAQPRVWDADIYGDMAFLDAGESGMNDVQVVKAAAIHNLTQIHV